MLIKPAEKSDIPAINALYEQFYQYNANQQPYFYQAATENGKYPESVIDNESEELFVADSDGKIIGLIHVAEDKTPPYKPVVSHRFAVIVDLFVDETCRGLGAGKELMKAAKKWAEERELDYMELMVLQENELGNGFYKHEGFQTVSHTMRFRID
jgi:ribosomal protein S18 acetylase RimI-like enzyme